MKESPRLLSLLYDIGLMPEQCNDDMKSAKSMRISMLVTELEQEIEQLTKERELFRDNYKELLGEAKNLYTYDPNNFRKTEDVYFKEEIEFLASISKDKKTP